MRRQEDRVKTRQTPTDPNNVAPKKNTLAQRLLAIGQKEACLCRAQKNSRVCRRFRLKAGRIKLQGCVEIRGCHCAQRGNQPDGLMQNLEWISLLRGSKVTDKPLASEKSRMDARDLKAPLPRSNKLALGLGPLFPSLK